MKFFSKLAVGFVSFWFGPLAGGYLLARNFKQLSDNKAARTSLVIAILFTLLIFPIILFLPESVSKYIPKYLVSFVSLGCAYALYGHFQEKKIKECLEKGASKESDWKAAGIGLLFFLLMLIYVIPLVLYSSDIKTMEYNIGCFFERRENGAEAIKWFRRAADRGYPPAYTAIGLQYNWGRGVLLDYNEALRWYQKGSDSGDAGAQYNLGVYYMKGVGVKQDYGEAMKLYEKAAQQGDTDAEFNLGTMYLKALGVKEDDARGALWLRKAAEKGNANAQFDLGVLYQMGAGVDKNLVEAKKWFQKAAQQGDEESRQKLKSLN